MKLATELSKIATGRTLYILDEPTTGLHFADVQRLLEVLQRLVDAGNSVVVIEHNLDVIKSADRIIDMGPEGGEEGGLVVAAGTPEEVARGARPPTPGSSSPSSSSRRGAGGAPAAQTAREAGGRRLGRRPPAPASRDRLGRRVGRFDQRGALGHVQQLFVGHEREHDPRASGKRRDAGSQTHGADTEPRRHDGRSQEEHEPPDCPLWRARNGVTRVYAFPGGAPAKLRRMSASRLWLQKWRWYQRNSLPWNRARDPLAADAPRRVRALAAGGQRARSAARGTPGGRGRRAVRAGRLDHRPGARAGADRRRHVPEPQRDGRLTGARRDRRALHARQRLLRLRRQPPLRRPRDADHVAGLREQGPDPDRRQLLARSGGRRDQRGHDRRALRDRRQQRRDARHPALLDRRRRARARAALDRVRQCDPRAGRPRRACSLSSPRGAGQPSPDPSGRR